MTVHIYLTDRQVAERYNLGGRKKSAATVWRWVKAGTNGFPTPHRFSDKCSRWLLADLEAWEKTRADRAPRESILRAAEASAEARQPATPAPVERKKRGAPQRRAA